MLVSNDMYEFERVEVPIEAPLRLQLISFWEIIFQVGFSWLNRVLEGGETSANRDVLYLARQGEDVVASCRLTISLSDPRVGAIGEVATVPEHRGKGLAQRLCRWAADDFDEGGGEALFLATGNPVAAKLYTRLGWRSLVNSAVMLRVKEDVLPEEFMVDHFRRGKAEEVRIVPGGPAQRVPMVPLILSPHDWIMLDANTSILSIRYFYQQSCEGLYTRYEALDEPGTWFAATRSDGAVVGLASARDLKNGEFLVEAFAHARHQKEWLKPLYVEAAQHCRRHDAESVQTTCAKTDFLKQEALEALGFQRTDGEIRIDLTVRSMDALTYRLSD